MPTLILSLPSSDIQLQSTEADTETKGDKIRHTDLRHVSWKHWPLEQIEHRNQRLRRANVAVGKLAAGLQARKMICFSACRCMDIRSDARSLLFLVLLFKLMQLRQLKPLHAVLLS